MEVLLQVDKIGQFFIILFSFTSGWGVDEVVDNGTNYQGYQYNAYSIQCQILITKHLENREGVG